MNRTVKLVNEWAAFEEKHPNAGIDAFCRHYLLKQRTKHKRAKLLAGLQPPAKSSLLTKLLVKIVRMHGMYMAAALKDVKIKQPEEFYFLSVIKNLNAPKKTEVIYHTVNELSNGLNILGSLLNQGYITEQTDEEDKRSKRIGLTKKGEGILKQCYEKVHQVSELMFAEMEEDDIILCIQLLKNIEIRFSDKWLQDRSKPFEEVYQSLIRDQTKDGDYKQ